MAGAGVRKLGRDADPFPGFSHAALEYIADAQVAPDRLNAGRGALVHRAAGRDRQPRDLCECGDEVFAEPVAEMPLLRIVAHVVEWQDCDGRRV